MSSRLASKTLFLLPFLALAACAAPTTSDDETEGADSNATEDELRAGGCISGDKIVPNLYDFDDVPAFTRTSSASFTYSPANRVVSNEGNPGCESWTGSVRTQCRAAHFTAKSTSWGPKDETLGRLLLTTSNGGGGFLMIAPKDYVYCSANTERAVPPRLVLRKSFHVQVTPEGFDAGATTAQIDAALGRYCEPGTFDRASFLCIARDGLTVDVASYVKTPAAGGR